tara:strand:+ start:611 stop:2332 length:1722 start_codon:yes stop_codon:yes gene_type:complete
MAELQQLSPNVYYVAPPGKNFNQFASMMANYLKVRTPWTTELFRMRVQAMDPTAKLRALQQLERERMRYQGSYDDALEDRETAIDKAVDDADLLTDAQEQLLVNRLNHIQGQIENALGGENVLMKPDDKQEQAAATYLTNLLPQEILKLRQQVEQGGLPLDVWGDFGDRDRLANAYKGGPGPVEGIASLTGDGRGINQALSVVADYVEKWTQLDGIKDKEALQKKMLDAGVPENLVRYRPGQMRSQLESQFAMPEAPKGDDYWEGRRREIIDAYDNPFGAVGAPLPGRAVARTRLGRLFGGNRRTDRTVTEVVEEPIASSAMTQEDENWLYDLLDDEPARVASDHAQIDQNLVELNTQIDAENEAKQKANDESLDREFAENAETAEIDQARDELLEDTREELYNPNYVDNSEEQKRVQLEDSLTPEALIKYQAEQQGEDLRDLKFRDEDEEALEQAFSPDLPDLRSQMAQSSANTDDLRANPRDRPDLPDVTPAMKKSMAEIAKLNANPPDEPDYPLGESKGRALEVLANMDENLPWSMDQLDKALDENGLTLEEYLRSVGVPEDQIRKVMDQ